MSSTSRVLVSCILLAAAAAPGCGDSNEATARTSLLAVTPEGAGQNCAHGGQTLVSGVDTNNNGKLDEDEISRTDYVCNGQPGEPGDQGEQGELGGRGEQGDQGDQGGSGLSSLVAIRDELPGTTCPQGGKTIDVGLDSNGNGALDASEVSQSQSLCNGLDGANGSPGAPGSDGWSSLLDTAAEPAGDHCEHGGIVVRSGLDNGAGNGTASNGTLEAGEVSLTQYVCNGADGTNGSDGFNALIASQTEAEGENCEHGGTRLDYGVDDGAEGGTARNGELEAGEITDSLYVCSGAPGSDGEDGAAGATGTIVVTPEPIGDHCGTGGQRIEVGLDANGDGALAGAEVSETVYVCNGHTCGDGHVGGTEQCDDGNRVDDDDCTNACRAKYIASYTGGGQTIYQMKYRNLPSGDARAWYQGVCEGAGLAPVSCDPDYYSVSYNASAWGAVALNQPHYSCNVSSGIGWRTGWSNVLTFHTPNSDAQGVCQNGCTITGAQVSPVCTDPL